jgi:putative membrane-bound dehydrogenase-like protein
MKRLVFCFLVLLVGADQSHRAAAPSTDTSSAFDHPKLVGPDPTTKPFEYVKAEGIPFYEPGTKAYVAGGVWNQMPKPLPPEESKKNMILPEGFEAKLFVAEPDVINPLTMAWDERGRLWVVESFDYPNRVTEPGKGSDRIKICEDTDGDGRADKFSVFAEGLNMPASITFANGGVIVPEKSSTWFLKDTDGDGKADVKKELFTGWYPRQLDTHAGPNNFRYGLDNWIWGMVGYGSFDGTVGRKSLRFQQGFLRFRPDGGALEYLRSTSNNTWGLGFSEEGIAFGSTANGCPSVYLPIPNRYYESVRGGWAPEVLKMISPNYLFKSPNPKVRQVDWHGGYTAAAGHALYTARAYPKEYWNRTAFVAEPTGHLVGTFVLEPQGSDFKSHNPFNLLASMDEWTSPIMAEVGPDGFVWVIDWYAYIVQHNPTPQGYENGPGNAYVTPRRADHKHGRIYRIVYTGGTPSKPLDLSKATPSELVAALRNDNQLWRMHAQRLLVEKQDKSVVEELIKLASDRSVDEIGLNVGAIHALWALQGLGAFDGSNKDALAAAVAALKHPSAGVRRNAVQVLPASAQTLATILDSNLLADSDAQVRLIAFLAIADQPTSEKAGVAVYAALKRIENITDRWIPDAAIAAAAKHDAAFLHEALAQSSNGGETKLGEVVGIVTRHYADRAPTDSIIATLEALTGAEPRLGENVLNGLVAGWPDRADAAPVLTDADKSRIADVGKSLPVEQVDRLMVLANRWRVPEIFAGQMEAVLKTVEATLTSAASSAERADAAKRMIRLKDEPATITAILAQVTPQASSELSKLLILSLADSRLDGAAGQIVGRWRNFTPAARESAVSVMLRRAAWTNAMLKGIEDKKLARNDLSASDWQTLKANRDRNIAALARKLDTTQTNPDRLKVLQAILPALERKGDVAAGQVVFANLCFKCHAFNGQGGKIGPELSGIGTRDPKELLAEIIDPNRSVEANYRTWDIETRSHEFFAGRLNAETQTTVELLDATGQRHVIPRKDIRSMNVSALSVMPVGLIDTLKPDEVSSLMAYLKTGHPAAAFK